MGRKKNKKKFREVLRSELFSFYEREAKELWRDILPELKEEDEEETIAPIIEVNLPYVIKATAIALELLKADPRGGMGTIVIKTWKGAKKSEEHGVKLRFKSIETVEAIDENGARFEREIWHFVRWDIYRTREGWKFQFEIDLTEEKPRLIRNFFRHVVMSVEVWSA